MEGRGYLWESSSMKSELSCFFFLGLMSYPAANCSQSILKMSATQCLLLLHCSLIGHKAQAAKQWAGGRSGLDSASCVILKYNSLLWWHTSLLFHSFWEKKTDWDCAVHLANNWYLVITDRENQLQRVYGQWAFLKSEMLWAKWKCNVSNVMEMEITEQVCSVALV